MIGSLRRCAALALVCGLAAMTAPASAQKNEGVDLELVLAVDVSGSMDYEEQELQRQGYIQAFRHSAVLNAIRSGVYGRIAVTYVQWAGAPEQTVPWTTISNKQEAEAFASAIDEAPLYSERGTSLSSAITFSTALLDSNTIAGARKVIDISGDGPNNAGDSIVEARAAAIAKGITINGIPLLMNVFAFMPLDEYYRECVMGGRGAFVIPVKSMDAFAASIRAKLVTEIAGLDPEHAPELAKFQLAQATAPAPRNNCEGARYFR